MSHKNFASRTLAVGWALSLWARPSLADEPRKVSEPMVLREPAEIVQIVDAFDEDDLFDLHLSLGYRSTWKNSKIRRESSVLQPGLTTGGYTKANMNVAEYSETTSRLLT